MICRWLFLGTHDAFGEFYANNISHVAKIANTKLGKHGIEVLCETPSVPHKYTKSDQWFLVYAGEIEILDNTQDAANDESFIWCFRLN